MPRSQVAPKQQRKDWEKLVKLLNSSADEARKDMAQEADNDLDEFFLCVVTDRLGGSFDREGSDKVALMFGVGVEKDEPVGPTGSLDAGGDKSSDWQSNGSMENEQGIFFARGVKRKDTPWPGMMQQFMQRVARQNELVT